MWATASSSTGAPYGEGAHATSSNFPGRGTAMRRHRSSWSWAKTLMQYAAESLISPYVPDVVVGMNATSGGSRETAVKVPTTIPTGWPSADVPVTTVTPVG